MRTLGPIRARRIRRRSAFAGLAALALAPGAAFATCTTNISGSHIFAGPGDTCFAAGTYSTTTNGLVAGEAKGGGAITNGEGTASFSTTGITTPALLAVDGGSISLNGGTVTTTGAGSQGILADQPGSTVTMSGASVLTTGDFVTNTEFGTTSYAVGLAATEGATASFTGGTITTEGRTAFGVVSGGDGSTVTLTGTTDAPLAILTKGDGSGGLVVTGASSLTATGVTVTTHGGVDSTSGYSAFGAYNGAAAGTTTGGAMTLTDTAIATTGPGATGVITADGGQTTINGGSISTSGDGALGLQASGAGSSITTTGTTITTGVPYEDVVNGANAHGVQADTGGAVTLNGGSVSTAGTNAIGLYATGAGSSVTTLPYVVEDVTSYTTMATTGANAHGVLAYSGGAVTLNGGSVTATGAGAQGLFAIGADESGTASLISASGVDVSISSATPNAHAALAYEGGQITMTGGSATTAGNSNYVAGIYGGGRIDLNGVTLSATGDGSGGVFVNGTGGDLNATNVSITTQGGQDTSTGNYADGAFNGSYPGAPGGGMMTITDSTIATTGTGADGVVAADGGQTTIKGGSITTMGAGADALLAESGGVITIGASDAGPATIATGGTGAFVAAATSGGKVVLSGLEIATSANGSGGLGVTGAGSEIDATNLTISTTGGFDSASGLYAYGAANGPYGGSSSGGVLKLTDTAISTHGAGIAGVFTGAGGATTILGGSITTAGTLAHAVIAGNGGTTTIGLSQSESPATAISTTGTHALGVLATNGGIAQLTGATIATSGDGSTGLAVEGAGSSLTASGIGVTTQGGVDSASGAHSDGAFNGPSLNGSLPSGGSLSLTNSTIATSGASAPGVATSAGGTTTISGGSVSTSGYLANAILSEQGGSTTIGASTAGPVTITTAGNDSAVVVAQSGGFISLTGATVSAIGAMGSSGLVVHDAGSELDATNVTVTTQGGVDPATGRGSIGLYNGPFGTSVAGGVAKLTNSSVSTQGDSMHGVVTSTGGTTTISGVAISTGGDGAIGLYANGGGVISGTGSATIMTTGGVSATTSLGASGVVADGAGSQINLGAATITTSGAGAFGLLASDAAASGSAGSIAATGTLTINTTNPAAAAVGLEGNGASILATGGGTITSAGNAIGFLGGTNQTATFDNFTINNRTGDLIFADPSVATINFNATIANAGLNNLLDATNGSIVTLNANASTLTGAIKTDPTSTTNVNLANGTTWTMTGSSNITNLAVTNSIVVFAPPGAGEGFKTLTVTNYVGSGANITMNAALGGSPQASDQIIVNGGKATGFTLLTINNFGGLGGQTSGAGIPLVVATNGGTVAPGAFALANTPLAGGFRYMLQESNNDWYLVSTPAPTPGQIQGSINQVAKAQQTQIITNRVLNSILLGATQQISTCSCGGGFASVGSFAAGAQGRWGLSDELTLIGGFSYSQWNASGISVENAPTVAGSLVYDLWKWGESRPFFGVGGALTPYEDVHYSRTYPNGLTIGVGNASAIDRDLSLFARAGWIDRLSPVDEAAVYGDLGRSWMQTGGYTEMTSGLNPFPSTVAPGLDTLNVARVGGQITHLFNGNIEANVSAAVAYGFGAGAGAATSVYDFGPIAANALPNTTWVEYGARLGYRFSDRLVIDAFLVGTAFGEVGTTVHGGVGLRYAF